MDSNELLKDFWDYIDIECISNRKEYTEQEQEEIIDTFNKSMESKVGNSRLKELWFNFQNNTTCR